MVISTPTEVEEADVYKAGQRAARLARRGGAIVFDYDPDYLAAGAQPVAITLPLSDEPIVSTGGSIPPFFAGLLPEGARLHALVARVKTSADDMLSLLLAVGQDTVGDVAVLPVGTQPELVAPVLEVGSWAETDFVELLAGSHPSSRRPSAARQELSLDLVLGLGADVRLELGAGGGLDEADQLEH